MDTKSWYTKTIRIDILEEREGYLFKEIWKAFKPYVPIKEMFTFQQIAFLASQKCFLDFPEDLKDAINNYLDEYEEKYNN